MAIVTAASRRSTATGTWVAFWVMVIGGLNWGLVGLFRFDLVAAIFGDMSIASRVIYILVAIATVYCAIALPALKTRANATRDTATLNS
jgi:uncharacterized membrane protein YuzA (DUF378 family)